MTDVKKAFRALLYDEAGFVEEVLLLKEMWTFRLPPKLEAFDSSYYGLGLADPAISLAYRTFVLRYPDEGAGISVYLEDGATPRSLFLHAMEALGDGLRAFGEAVLGDAMLTLLMHRRICHCSDCLLKAWEARVRLNRWEVRARS